MICISDFFRCRRLGENKMGQSLVSPGPIKYYTELDIKNKREPMETVAPFLRALLLFS